MVTDGTSGEPLDGWPHDTSLAAFRAAWTLEGEALWRRVYDVHRDHMQIKNARAALRNLEKIFQCTFRLANTRGFQAMSLRDLSRETGISMGGLYAYIGSKHELASAIEAVLRQTISDFMNDLDRHSLDPYQRLRAIIHGDLYMNDTMHSWYYFCYLEAKGLTREQRDAAMQMELQFDEVLKKLFQEGRDAGLFHFREPAELLASLTTAQLQQWYLKRWKFQQRRVRIEDYADFLFRSVLDLLGYREPAADTQMRQTTLTRSPA